MASANPEEPLNDTLVQSPLFGGSPSSSDDTSECLAGETAHVDTTIVASTNAPPIPGLYFDPAFLSDSEQQQCIAAVAGEGYFDAERGRDQAVLFGASGTSAPTQEEGGSSLAGLPIWMLDLLKLVEKRVREKCLIDDEGTLQTVFAPLQNSDVRRTSTLHPICIRQCILNLYSPGQGIKAHIDIPHRFLDGIVLLSFGSGIAMEFMRERETADLVQDPGYSLYLTPGSLCILTGEARWRWTHGIAERLYDRVQKGSSATRSSRPTPIDSILRGQRLSITARWLQIKPEGDFEDHESGTQDDLAQASLR